MDEFINRIIELDRSINDLEQEFNNRKNIKNLDYKDREERLRKKYEEDFLREKNDYILKSKEMVEEFKNREHDLTNRKYDEVNKKYLENKERLLSKIFDEYFLEGSD